jgi:sulfite reductase (ferredoxin)
VDGKVHRGFRLFVGGGLGAVPHQAKVMMEFCPEEEVLPMARAIGRVFARLGEKKNRQKARLKFVVAKLGIEEFKKVVEEERRTMPEDPSWRNYFDRIAEYHEEPVNPPTQLNGQARPEGFDAWAKTNLYPQRQNGYSVVTVTCPLGDLTSKQMRALAHLSDRYAGGNLRTTVEQNLVFRWVSSAWRQRAWSSTRRFWACASRSAAASIPAASTTWPTWGSMVTAATLVVLPSRISRS